MAINLPNSPTNGQTVTLADKTLVYNSTSGTWNVQTTDSSGGSLSISDTAPSSPSDGDMWFDSSTLTLYAYYDDGNSQQWIDLAGQATTLQATSSDTAPADPSTGAIWFDTANLNLFVYYSDGSSNQWVQMNSEAPAIPEDLSDLTDTTNLLFDGQYSSLTGAPTSSTAGALGTLTKTFTQNEETEITLSETISPVPNVSVFKEVPQGGLTSKGNWDVNANANNYEFFDEKPLNYNTTTLTPSATGDGTFTSSNPTVTNYVHSKLTADNSGLSNSGSPLHTLVTSAGTHDNQGTLDMYGVWMSPAGDKILAIQVFTNDIYRNRLHGFNVANPFSTTDADITYQTTGNGYYDIADGTTNSHRNATFGIDPTGTHLYTFRNNTLYQYVATTGWEASTFSFTNNTFVPSGNGIPPTYDWQCPPTIPSNNGDYLLFCSANDGYVARYTMTTAWDCSTCSSKQELDAATLLSNAGYTSTFFRSAQYNSDGTLLLLGNNDQFFKLSLSTPYDITTASFVEASSSGLTLGYYGLWITSGVNEGKYVVGQTGGVSGGIVIQPTSESVAFSSTDVGKKVVGNSGAAVITATSGTYTSVTAFADTSAISSWQLFAAQGKSDGSGIELSGYSAAADIVFPTGASGSGASMVYSNNVSPTSSAFNNLRNVVFNPTGTIALVMTSGNIQRWNLSTAFDLATMTEATGDNFSGQLNTTQYGLAVSPDGTKLFVGDHGNDVIKQFTLSTPWSPSTESYNGYYSLNNGGNWNSFTGADGVPSTTNFNPFSFQFNSDGTKMITTMWDNAPYHSVVEFALSTGFDMSTMAYTSFANFDGTVDLEAIVISPDGLKIMMHGYNLGNTGTEVYALGSAFSVGNSGNSLTKTSGTIDLSSLTGNTNAITYGGLQMSSDGKRMWAIYSGDNKFYEITGGTTSVHPYSTYSPALTSSSNGQINSSSWVDIDSMVADETKNGGDVFYAVSTDDRTSWGVIKDGDGVRKIARNNSGTWQYNNNAGTSTIAGYDLSSSASLSKTLSYSSQDASGSGMAFNNDGTKLYFIGEQNDIIHEYVLSTAYDISTSSYNSVTFNPSVLAPTDIKWKPDGTKLYILDYDSSVRGTIYTFNVSTAWDITTASSASETFRGNAQDGSFIKFAFKTDGTMLFKLGRQGNRIHAYNLSTAWDVSTASYASAELPMANVVSGSTTGTSMNGLAFNSSGTKVFVTVYHSSTASSNRIYEIDLSTAWDIGIDNNDNGNYAGVYLQTPSAINVLFNGDGSQVYSMNNTTDTILSYSSGSATIIYGTSETWVNGTNNNEHATLQEALGAQSFNRMDKAQLQAVTDPNHYVLGDTLDLMIAPYAASGTSPLSDGVTIGYQADALIKQAINGTDYEAEFPATNKVMIKSLAAQNLKIRII